MEGVAESVGVCGVYCGEVGHVLHYFPELTGKFLGFWSPKKCPNLAIFGKIWSNSGPFRL